MTRPEFHFTADRGWINDPHGITFHDGQYHQFHQFVPDSLVWAPNCHWGHAVGRDMFSLQHRPVALAPGEGDDGIWTGCLVIDDEGKARILYTSVVQPDIGVGRIRVAFPADSDWTMWTKGDVLIDAPEQLDIVGYRDPFVFRDGPLWRMYVGAGLAGGIACALGYVSSDLQSWTYEGIAAARSASDKNPAWMGSLWECPQLIPLADAAHVLVSSVWDDDVLYYAGYGVGRYSDGRFEAETWGQLTFGNSYYAPSFFRDAAGRPCLVFWMRGVSDPDNAWSSAHSVPYVLELDQSSRRLTAAPHPDLEQYRRKVDGETVVGSAADIVWNPGQFGLLTLAGADESIELTVGATEVTLTRTGAESIRSVRYSIGPVRLIVDGPCLEMVVDGTLIGTAITALDEVTVQASGTLELYALER